MNRYKRLGILAGILALAVAATIGAMKYQEHKEEIQNSGETVLSIDSGSVKALSWSYEGETLAFHKGESAWLYDGDEAFPVDQEKVSERLELFQEFNAAFVIDNVEDYGQYGLDKPVCTINLTTDSGTHEIKLGDFSKMDSQRYVSLGDGRAFLVKKDPLDYFNAKLKDMIDHDETPEFEKIRSIQFSGPDSYRVAYQEEGGNSYRESDVYFAERDGESLPLDTALVEKYLQTVSSLHPTDYVSYNATEDELQKHGLNNPELIVTVDYTITGDDQKEAAKVFTLHVSRDPEDLQAASESGEPEKDAGDSAGEADKDVKAYIRVGDSKIIYQIDGDRCKKLMAATYDDLRHRELLPAELSDVNRIDVTLEGSAYTLTAEGEGKERAWYYKGEKLESDDFPTALTQLKADSFTSETPEQREEISLTVHLSKAGAPEIQIALYRYNGSHCLAAIDGKPVSLIARADVVRFIEAVNAIVLN